MEPKMFLSSVKLGKVGWSHFYLTFDLDEIHLTLRSFMEVKLGEFPCGEVT